MLNRKLKFDNDGDLIRALPLLSFPGLSLCGMSVR